MATNPSLNSLYILLGGILVAAVGFVFLILQPMLNEINSAQEAIVQEEARLQERRDFLETIDRKLAVLQTQAAHEQQLEVLLPTSERVEDALRILHQAEAVAGVKLERVTNQSAQAQGAINAQRARGEAVDVPADVTPLTFLTSFSGTYQQLRAFLAELEKSPRLMDVTAVKINRQALAPDQVSGELTIVFYVQQSPNLNEL